VDIVRHVAHVLDTDRPTRQVKRVLRTYLNRLQATAPRRGRGAATGRFIDHLVRKSDSYWPGLFHTYDHPLLPPTTNGLEGFFGSSKQAIRRTTGRMSTAGGKLQSCGEALIRVSALHQALAPTELKERLSQVPPHTYQEAKRRLRQLQRPARERRSIQRDLDAYLQRSLNAWLDSS
jgi:hypothetical protein